MSLAKAYTPQEFETLAYAIWEKSEAFSPSGKGEPFSIIMPPPNANDNLHIGHGLDMNLKDVIARYQRSQGKNVVFIPGADHAGFETWVVYDRKFLAGQGLSRFDFTRDELYQKVWQYVDERRGDMELQIRAMGTSASWQDMVFSLDEKVIKTTYETFKKLWDEGLVYRGKRLVNYCTQHQTGFADIEVDYSNEKGCLWNIAYPFADEEGEIVIATTRPETLLGDMAVAVHPDDLKYKHLIGKELSLPIVNKRIPIIDDEYVDPTYGTGAVKITPAHDPNDFEVGKRHNLTNFQVINKAGKMVNVPDTYLGKDPLEAREQILEELAGLGLLRGKKEIEHAVGQCYKCKTTIQPMLMDQWFISVQPLAQKTINVMKDTEISFLPKSKKKEAIDYLEQLQDWNISRQIPWGIPIPAFVNEDDSSDWIFDERVNQEKIVVNNTTYLRDVDTFDTWFSSGQWPYIVTDALLEGGKLKDFYPVSLLETGADILRPWVCRMLMLGVYRTGKLPFKDVYLHGMVNDQHNQKMSKSKGNVINPMDVIDKYGSDAFRIGILSNRSPGQNQAYSDAHVIAGRNFCNKLWNVARFVEHLTSQINDEITPSYQPKSLADAWVTEKINETRDTLESLLSQYRVSEAVEVVYHFVWDEIADWYIEVAKTEKNLSMLTWVLRQVLIITHPFAPFVTETIWQTLPWEQGVLASTLAEKKEEPNLMQSEKFKKLQELVKEVRFVMAELPGNKKYPLLYGNDLLVEESLELVLKLTKATHGEKIDQPRGLRLATGDREVWLDIDSETLYEHQENLEIRLLKTKKEVEALEKRLSNENYVKQAPNHLVEESRKKLEEKQKEVQRFIKELSSIKL